MWNFQRIICIWICCVSCMFGTTQLSSLVQAVPYEYFDEHEQSFYDLDTEQIQAKYDTRLLSKQMLQIEQQKKEQQQQEQQHLENSKGFYNIESMERVVNRKPHDAAATLYASTSTTKLKNNDGHTMNVDARDGDDNDDERNYWQEETATKAAALTSTITETLDELHLPRAASCFTNGQKFTHGQKVPRLDNCEVCLCMDGEIFCWWEKCDKKPTKASKTYDDYSTPFEEFSTIRMQSNPITTFKTTLKPMKISETSEDYKYDDDDSAEIRAIQQEYEGLRQQQLLRNEQEAEQNNIYHNKQIAKNIRLEEEKKEKNNKKLKEQKKCSKKQEGQQQNYKHEKPYKTNEHFEKHYHTRNHNKKDRNNKHDYSLSSSSSKILNFPENLPSVLYYDYKTEEHHQHQHQHREQHLKHQKQKQQQQLLLQQHEKGLKYQQQNQQQQQQQHVRRIHEYGQDFNTYSSSKMDKTLSDSTARGREEYEKEEEEAEISGSRVQAETNLHNSIDGSSTTLKYFSNGNDNFFNSDSETDSDILPEPPTKKPKFLTSIIDTRTTEKIPEISLSQLNHETSSVMATTAGTIAKSIISTNTFKNTSASELIPKKKQFFSLWNYKKTGKDKISKSENKSKENNSNNNNNNNESTEDITDSDDQDDAFHRWLTSTETNNKNNFTLNNGIIGRAGSSVEVVARDGGLDSTNNDFNVKDKNYENVEPEIGTEFAVIKTKIKQKTKPLEMMKAAKTTMNVFDIHEEIVGGEAAAAIYSENSQTLINEQNFSDNNSSNNKYNNVKSKSSSNNMANNNEIINSNGKNDNNINSNNLAFNSNSYENYYINSDNIAVPTSSNRRVTSSSIASNEDGGVADIVNIDILLTASSANGEQQKPQQTNIETTNQHQQLQLQNFEHEKQAAKTKQKFMQPPVLTSNTNDDNNNPLYSIINDNTRNLSTNSNDIYNNTYNIVGDGLNIKEQTQLQNVGVNFSSSNHNNNNHSNSNASIYSLSSSGNNFKFPHISAVVSKTNTSSAAAAASKTTPPPLSTTSSPERQCNVMGTMYKIGDILPQDTGNCLQCICIDGSTSDDTPRVTCSPHNCPPLVLPDLFDATGY